MRSFPSSSFSITTQFSTKAPTGGFSLFLFRSFFRRNRIRGTSFRWFLVSFTTAFRFFPSLFALRSLPSSPNLFRSSVSLLSLFPFRKSLEGHRIQGKPIESLFEPLQSAHFLPLSARSAHQLSSFPHPRFRSPLLDPSAQGAPLYSHYRACDKRVRCRYFSLLSSVSVGSARVWSQCSQSRWKSLLLAGYGVATWGWKRSLSVVWF